MTSFQENLSKYANLLIRKGINVQAGDWVKIYIQVDQAELARLLTEAAYKAGAEKVLIDWSDDFISRSHYQHQSEETLTTFSKHYIKQIEEQIDDHHISRLSIVSSDPGALNEIDPDKIQAVQAATSKALKRQREATMNDDIKWTVAAAAGSTWAARVFPNLDSQQEQIEALWDQIFQSCRVYEDDPIKAWDSHLNTLLEKADILNKYQFTKFQYKASGTDFTLGLPENHIWASGQSVAKNGDTFVANMPTEEVFTAPDTRIMNGQVTSTKPLSYAGNLIENIIVQFEDGKITKITANPGQETMEKLVFENEGGQGLGEVALVPHQSPISQSGLIFFNTLFDENASNHLAIGEAYPTTLQGGTKMATEELKAVGLNVSPVHVDFMIGSEDMDIDGITKEGDIIPVFRKGEWAI